MNHGRLLVVCAILAGLLLGVGLTVYAASSGRNDAAICEKVNRLNDVIVALLVRSQRALPANPYYRDHPELLAEALKQNRRALRDFRGAAC